MRRLSLAILPALLLAAGCPPAPIDKPAASPKSTGSPEADRASAKACSDAAAVAGEASKLAKEGRFLRASVLFDQAEGLCPKRDPAVIRLHAEALAEIGRCAGVMRLAGAAGKSVDIDIQIRKSRVLCAERTRGAGDAAAEEKSRALARKGQITFRQGDLALAELLAARAIDAAATDEALLLDARVQEVKGDKKRARLAFDRAFAALERAGEARLSVIPHPRSTASRDDASQVTIADGGLWIVRSDIPDRVAAVAWADAPSTRSHPRTQGVAAVANGRFVVVGDTTIALLDIESARILDSSAEEKPALRVLEGGRRALILKANYHPSATTTKLVDLTDPARLKVIETYPGMAIDEALDGSAFVVDSYNTITVVDAATGKETETFKATDAAISSDGKLVAVCRYGRQNQYGDHIPELVLFDRARKYPVWTKIEACAPTAGLSFDEKDRNIFALTRLRVKDGLEAGDDPEPPSPAESPKAASLHWFSAGMNESTVGCTRDLSGDGALFTGGCHADAGVYEARTGKMLFKWHKPITLPPRGSVIATEEALCDVRTGACTPLAKHCKTRSVTFSTAGERALCVSSEGDGLREIRWDGSLAIKTSRVFPGSKDWVPVFLGPRGAGVMRLSASAIELLFLDFDKGTTISAGQPMGVLFSPDGGVTVSATAGEPSLLNLATGKRSALPDHAGIISATLVAADGKTIGLQDTQSRWRFWAVPEGRLLGRLEAQPEPKPGEPMLLSAATGRPAQLLTTGYVAGSLAARNRRQLNLVQGFWLAPVSQPSHRLEARWTGKGGYLLETRAGSHALGKARVEMIGEGTAIVACAFGDAVIAPLEVCREAFVWNGLASAAFGAVPP